MAIFARRFDRRYLIRPKGSGAGEMVQGETLVTELEPTDFPQLEPGAVAQYASRANQNMATRLVTGSPKYWGGITSNQHLATLLAEGWEEGTAAVAELAEAVRDFIPRPKGSRRRQRWQDQGDEVDMAKVYNGQLETAWRSAVRQRARAPRVITIDADVGQNCHVTADALKWSGVAAVALTVALEQAGYRVELFSTSAMRSNSPGGGAALTRVLVKRSGERLVLPTVAALVALPATFRWYHVMSWLAHPAPVGGGYGQSAHLQEVLDAAMQEHVLAGSEIVLTGAFSRGDAIRQVTNALRALEASEQSASGTMRY